MMSLAGLGFSKGYAKNEPTIAIQDILNKEYETVFEKIMELEEKIG